MTDTIQILTAIKGWTVVEMGEAEYQERICSKREP